MTGATDSSRSDAAAIAASLDDPLAFGAIFDRHADAVFGYFARRTLRAEAADLTAETFRLAFGARARFDPAHASVRPWLYGFAGNVLRHRLRSVGREAVALRRLAAVPGEAEPLAEGAIDAAIDAERRWPAVAVALARLAPDDREALLLLAWEELTYAEIAVATGVPIGTVRSRIHRARRRIRELIEPDGQLPDDHTHRVPEEATDHG